MEFNCLDYKNKKHKNYNKAVFFDRDGTLHIDKVQTHKVEDLEFFPDVFDVIKYFQEKEYLIIIITNQDGIRKGVYNKETMHRFNMNMVEKLEKQGCVIDAIYYSPFKKEDNHPTFKPNEGMIKQAVKEFNLELDKCVIVGDKMTDMIAGIRGGVMERYLVTTGIYNGKVEDEEGYWENIDKIKVVKCLKDIIKK